MDSHFEIFHLFNQIYGYLEYKANGLQVQGYGFLITSIVLELVFATNRLSVSGLNNIPFGVLLESNGMALVTVFVKSVYMLVLNGMYNQLQAVKYSRNLSV